MVTVKIDEDTLLDMLMDRLAFWTDDYITEELYRQYYCDMISDGCFEGAELDVNNIVDNDYVNWLDVIYEDEFRNYNIKDTEDDRIVAYTFDNEEQKVYLIQCC